MLVVWAVLLVWLWLNISRGFVRPPFVQGVQPSVALRIAAIVLVALNGIFISYFWLNGVKDFIYVFWYALAKRSLLKRFQPVLQKEVTGSEGKVLLLYCTCNDFDGESLARSMRQDYANTQTVILDSDEIIPENFVTECLRYFAAYENAGIVQANHIATRNRNFFMKLFHIGVNSHWPTYQTMKNRYGFSSMLGHGAMIRRECYEKAGGFPNLVAEDLCLSIEMRNHGYFVVFAPNIVCEEEYPVDYAAFKKRHSKWTQGNLEFIKKYTRKFFASKMSWFEKMDIVLFTYNLPLTAIFAFYILLNITFMPALGIDIGALYPVWMIVPTAVFFFSPMLNDVFSWIFRIYFFLFLLYLLGVVVLYGSMLFTSLASALFGMFGKKAKFIVTPKNSQKIGFLQALRIQYKELLFAAAIVILALVFSRSFLPVLLITATAVLSFFLLFFSNRKYTREQTRMNDFKTARISFSQNRISTTPLFIARI